MTLTAHRDHVSTACPGDRGYSQLDDMRQPPQEDTSMLDDLVLGPDGRTRYRLVGGVAFVIGGEHVQSQTGLGDDWHRTYRRQITKAELDTYTILDQAKVDKLLAMADGAPSAGGGLSREDADARYAPADHQHTVRLE